MAEETKKKRAFPKGRHVSQIKRERQDLKRHARNLFAKSRLKTAIKKVRVAITKKDRALATQLFKETSRLIQKAASKKIIHSRNAARKVSRLSSAIHSLAS